MRAMLRAMLLVAAVAFAARSSAIEIKLESGVENRRAASFEMGGTKYRIQLIDGNKNKRYDDFVARPDSRGKCDAVMISCGKYGYGDEQDLGRYLLLGDKLFKVSIDGEGTKLTLEPAEGAAVTLPRGVVMATLIDEQTTSSVTVYDAAEKVTLPAGSYRLTSYTIGKKDDQGDYWFAAVFGSAKQRAYKADATAPVFAFGEPFATKIEIETNVEEGWFRDTVTAQMSFTIHDDAGARVGGIYHFGNQTKIPLKNGRPANPTWRALADGGEKAGSGQFEYG